MKAGDAEHRKAVQKCREEGHNFSAWEATKFVSGSERQCSRCLRHESLIRNEPLSASYAFTGGWVPCEEVDADIPWEKA